MGSDSPPPCLYIAHSAVFLEVLSVVYSLLNISVMLKMKVILHSFCIIARSLYQSDIMYKLLSWPGTAIFHTLTKYCY